MPRLLANSSNSSPLANYVEDRGGNQLVEMEGLNADTALGPLRQPARRRNGAPGTKHCVLTSSLHQGW